MPVYTIGIYKVATRHEITIEAPDPKTASTQAVKMHRAGKSKPMPVGAPEMITIQEKKK
jgi:hypothetical protein